MYKILSYPLTGADEPIFPGNPRTEFVPDARIEKGSPCNTTILRLFTHNGTHVDAPYHFNPNGRTIDTFGPEELIFSSIALVNCSEKKEGGKISPEDFSNLGVDAQSLEVFLIYSGASELRFASPHAYVQKSPSLSVEAASLLVTAFPRLRAIVVDFLSVESLDDANKGMFPVHGILSGAESPVHPEGILIVEDANLKPVLGDRIRKLFIVPLYLKGLDGSPVTLLAEVE